MAQIQLSQILPAPIRECFDYLSNSHNLIYLLKDSIQVQLEVASEELKKGAEYGFLMTRAGVTQSVRFRIDDLSWGNYLTYRQVEGVFQKWHHTQKFTLHGANQTLVTDIVNYELPMGLIGHILDDVYFRKDIESILSNRLNRAIKYFENVEVEKLKLNDVETISIEE